MFSKFKGKKWVEWCLNHLLEKSLLIQMVHLSLRYIESHSCKLIDGFENIKTNKHQNSLTSNQFAY